MSVFLFCFFILVVASKCFRSTFSSFFLYPLAVYGFIRGFRTWTCLRSYYWWPHPLKITATAFVVFIASDLLLPLQSSTAGFHQAFRIWLKAQFGLFHRANIEEMFREKLLLSDILRKESMERISFISISLSIVDQLTCC